MKAEIISVGTELLLGHTINTDAAHVARALSSLGIDLHHACVVGDNAARLEECLRAALQRSDLVITTGGLGPTNDDLTKETVARVLGLPLEEDADSLRRLREYFGDRPVGENQYKQAWLPRGSHAFANSVGTAPGCAAPAEGGKLQIQLARSSSCCPARRPSSCPCCMTRSCPGLPARPGPASTPAWCAPLPWAKGMPSCGCAT